MWAFIRSGPVLYVGLWRAVLRTPTQAVCQRALALSPCPPFQVLEVEVDDTGEPPAFEYDEEWLAILRTTRGLTNLT